MREREFKLGIPDEASFEALMAEAGGTRVAPVEQVNHFFDTPDWSLRERRIGLRLRREGGRFILTVKGPSASGEGAALLAERCELEADVPGERAEAVLRGERCVLELSSALEPAAKQGEALALLEEVRAVAAREPLRFIGSFGNWRTRVRTELVCGSPEAGDPYPVTLEFDCTTFAEGDVRREVEMEIAEDAPVAALQVALFELFERAGVSFVPTTSKLAYFMERLDLRSSTTHL